MSSRRKSTPARRLDTTSSALSYAANSGVGDDGGAKTPDLAEHSMRAQECVEDKGTENEINPGLDFSGYDRSIDSTVTRPPEGVYILQPESVSDNEDEMANVRKRSRTDNDEETDLPCDILESGLHTGLDLSVKRPRIDGISEGVENCSEPSDSNDILPNVLINSFAENSEVSPDLVEKYNRLMSLVAQQKPLALALESVGLDLRQFFALHRFNSQAAPSVLGKQDTWDDRKMALKTTILPRDFDVLPLSAHQFSSDRSPDDHFGIGKTKHDTKIENLLKEAKEDVIQHQKSISEAHGLNHNRLHQHPTTLDSSVAAAVMASLSSDKVSDESPEYRQMVLRNLLYKAHGMLNQDSSQSLEMSSLDRSTMNNSKIDSITSGTVSSGVGSIKKGTLDPSNFDEDVFDQYIAKYTNLNRCGLLTCQYYTRDHYHCVVEDCNYQRFTNKADVIRHYNMHKKRDNSLAHGFLRFSPTEDCSSKYPKCHLNGKSTHYHCMQPDCNKVYTSTSDVMTHENFHKKYMQFVCSGFKRFRATEQCDLELCTFRNQKTTHFHCTRSDCNFTFKNKCDIEKHKTYHLRDDQYISKGFKKFYKNETCGNNDCVWNYTANHFHCLRPSCNFSFTSTSQMESHKRKHDRNDCITESKDNNSFISYTSNSPKLTLFNPVVFQEAAKKILSSMPAGSLPHILGATAQSPQPVKSEQTHPGSTYLSRSEPVSPSAPLASKIKGNDEICSATDYVTSTSKVNADEGNSDLMTENCDPTDWPKTATSVISTSMAINAAAALTSTNHSAGSTQVQAADAVAEKDGREYESMTGVEDADAENIPSKFFASTDAYRCWFSDCDFFTRHHFHCLVENCEAMFTTKESVAKHSRFHESLELMGASLPIQSALPGVANRSETQESFSVCSTPPGYITLNSGVAKSRLLGFNESPSTIDSSPVPGRGEDENVTPSSVVPYLAYSQSHLTSLASQLYAGSLINNNSSECDSTPLCSTPVASYRFLHNPSTSIGALAAKMSQPHLVESVTDDSSLFGSKSTGYLHIKAGTPCLRSDCKYMHQNHWHCTISRCRYVCKSLGKAQTHREAHDSLDAYAKSAKECFRSYSVKKQCPTPSCEYRLRGHYHCLKPGCTFATIGTSKLPWHMKKHEKIARREASGFKYYTKKEQCCYQNCKYNGRFSHYHCVRKGCTFAFQYKHQMSTHVRKHLRRMLGRACSRGEVGDIDHTNVDSGDDSLPLIIDEVDEAEQRPGPSAIGNKREQLTDHQMKVLEQMAKDSKSLMEQKIEGTDCASLIPSTHSPVKLEQPQHLDNSQSNSDENDALYEALDLSAVAACSSKSNDSESQLQLQGVDTINEDALSNSFSQSADEADLATTSEITSGASVSPTLGCLSEPGQYSKFKLGSIGVLDGFRRFEANENCADERCIHMYKVSHYHCTRENCDYRFTGRSHMFKHQQHHDRVAGLVRDDFKRFKSAHLCDDNLCEFRGKNTHFHCLRCSFKCTDSAKVGTHRRQHMKADALKQSGFQRIRGKDDCGKEGCKYRFRNMSHFHCLQSGCDYTIVGLTGIELHAEKHRIKSATSIKPDNTNMMVQNLASLESKHIPENYISDKDCDDITAAKDINVQALAAIHSMQSQALLHAPHNRPSTPIQDQSYILAPASADTGHLLSKFAFLSSSNSSTSPIGVASSPASSRSMVTEGVGS